MILKMFEHIHFTCLIYGHPIRIVWCQRIPFKIWCATIKSNQIKQNENCEISISLWFFFADFNRLHGKSVSESEYSDFALFKFGFLLSLKHWTKFIVNRFARSNWNSNFMQNPVRYHESYRINLHGLHRKPMDCCLPSFFFPLLFFSLSILLVDWSLERFFQIHLNICMKWMELVNRFVCRCHTTMTFAHRFVQIYTHRLTDTKIDWWLLFWMCARCSIRCGSQTYELLSLDIV